MAVDLDVKTHGSQFRARWLFPKPETIFSLPARRQNEKQDRWPISSMSVRDHARVLIRRISLHVHICHLAAKVIVGHKTEYNANLFQNAEGIVFDQPDIRTGPVPVAVDEGFPFCLLAFQAVIATCP
ncbi:hypothetical protein [Phyllobacterium lublinensis]|uniref:hypothetical protein n=1 Tax=Phyllobacterium lublinensis TaxID=2875708 RepID=UPI001CCA83A6|nr:hypothetical protein [Phyllobacterium sp. 2063]MBZ9654657.1 hypothetical protein [Phyllobacterium sp. 2063]